LKGTFLFWSLSCKIFNTRKMSRPYFTFLWSRRKRMKDLLSRGAWLVLCLLLSLGFASAQVSKGSISGTVVDPSGAAITNAEIRVTSADTNQSITTTSNDVGIFKASLLPVGAYKVEISKEGFHKTSIAGISVTPGADTGLGPVKLELGATSETIEVSSGTPLIETTQAQVTNTFESTYLNNIPGIQENQGLDNLAVLLPGVSASRDDNFANTNGIGFSVNGLRGRNNDQQIDGQNNNDNSVAGPGIFLADTEFVSEYQVTTNNFGAEYGRNAGSVVNVITKSGTNTWHGSIYGTESNSVLTTLTNQQIAFEGLTKPPRFNDEFTGATIGGPGVKNKLFFFGGFDDEIESSNTIYGSGNLTPDPAGIAQLAGCYPGSASVSALQKYGPYAVGGNPTPQQGTIQVMNYPSNGYAGFVPNDGGSGCNVELAGVQRLLPDGNHQYNWVFRTDVTGTNDTFSARYLFQKQTFFNVDEGQAAQGYPVNVPSLGQQLGLSWTHKITNRMLNELRLNVGRENVQFGGNTLGTIPLQSNLEGGLANVSFAGAAASSSLLGFGPSTSFPQGRIINTYQLQDNWNYVRGAHQLKAGVNFTYQRSPNKFLPNANGEFLFSDWGTFAANVPNDTLITLGNPNLDFREYDSFYYFGDDWKVTKNLTLNLGLTYSYYGQPANLFHNNDAKQQSSNQPFWDPALPTSVTVFPSIPAPKNSWGPGIGFAYTPFGDKTVFRGGYRLSYDPPFYNIYLNIASSAPQVLAQTIVPGQPLPAAPFGPAVRTELGSFLTTGVSDPRTFSETSVAPNFGPDRVHSWSFGVERELGTHVAAEVRYVGNHAENLFQSINGNPYLGCGDPGCINPVSGGGETPGLTDGVAAGVYSASLLPAGLTPCPAASAVVASAVGRENCNEGKLRERTNSAYSDYDGLQTELRTNNLFNQLTLKTNYTWSKTTDNASEIFGTFLGASTYAFSQDPLNYTKAEHGLSGLDFPQTWTVSFNEAIPMFRGQHGILGHVLGGWSVAGSYILQSGQPYTPVQFVFASLLSPYNTYDSSFLASFNSGAETARPFLSNPSAPATAVGMYAGDACAIYGDATSCGAAPTSLVNLSTLNSTGSTTSVNADQVHFIANTATAQAINRTPFGTAARNSLRDYKTNNVNLELAKTVNWGERVRINWHMSLVNAFNHPNYNTIDPFIEDVGLASEGTGFANPTVQDGGNRIIRFGLKVMF
jgi:hypothetical protein